VDAYADGGATEHEPSGVELESKQHHGGDQTDPDGLPLDQIFTEASLARRRWDEIAELLSAGSRPEQSNDPQKETTMKLIRAITLLLAVCLPTTWTLAHAEDAPPAGETKPKKEKKAKKDKKAKDGDMGDMKKGDMK
jgi:hypothetical protein